MQRMMIAVLIAAALAYGLSKLWLPVLMRLKFGQNISSYTPEHMSKQGTPIMGGVALDVAALLTCLLLADWKSSITGSMMAAVMLMGFGTACIGFVDDMTKIRGHKNEGLTPKQKMIFQTIIALAFAVYCYFHPQVGSVIKIPFIRKELDLGILYIPLMMFVIVGTTNSANLLDGLDGLLSSVSMVDFATLAVMAAAAGLGELGVTCAALSGACMGFLSHNFYPAKMFQGDTGSMFIGGAISAVALLLRQPLILVIVAFWMLMSSLSVIIQRAYFRRTHGKRIFKKSPIHHHFELCGIHESKIVMMYMVTTVLLCIVALLGVL